MDLSVIRYAGLTIVEWAGVIAAILAIPPIIIAMRRASENKSSRTSVPQVTVVVNDTMKGGTRSSAEAIDDLTKAVIAAPIVHAVATRAIDKFSDEALAQIAASATDAASQAAAEIGLACAADAASAASSSVDLDGSLGDTIHDAAVALGKAVL